MAEFALRQSLSANGRPMALVEGGGANLSALREWITEQRESIEQVWLRHGSLRLRGFGVLGAEAFEQVALALEPDLKNDYLGTSPRAARSRYVFSASELPPAYPIPQHIEMSFLPSAPRKLFFHCTVAPARDGETPTVDMRAVWRALDPEVRAAFALRGVRNIRNYDGPASPKGFDLWKLKRWDELFQTTDRALAERKATEQGLRCQWLPQGRLRLVNEQAASRVHPVTGETVWFNHTQVFHVAAAAIEYRHIRRRQRGLRAAFFTALTATLTALKSRLQAPEQQGMHACFGDGGEISRAQLQHLVETIWQQLVIEPWQAGDVLAIDNRSTAHGRMPYSGPREVLVAWTGT
ncbi:MAG: TauD/TfdA family dioxygenase [Stagnimonas sp.]|nr:TauD/TfdA family dioxygenase [Stagnimonas sp.]